MFKIEKNVPVQPSRRMSLKYPFAEMDVGDSFFIEGERYNGSAATSARDYGKRHKKKFSGRNVEGGVRIWRVE